MYNSLIGKYRTQLMGLAILWVMLFHLPLNLSSIPILQLIKNMGYGGVDIFVFLSGFGIYHSLLKNSSIKDFYRKRILRILPYYLPIVLIFSTFYFLCGTIDFSSIILNLLTLSYWLDIDYVFDWYVPTILLFYLISPFFLRLFLKNKIVSSSVAIGISLILFFAIQGTEYVYLYGVVARFPLYILGIWFGHYCIQKPDSKVSLPIIILMSVVLVGSVILRNYLFDTYFSSGMWRTYGYSLIPFWFLTIPLCFFVSYLLSLLPRYKYPVLTFFGTYTLSLYIFHERIMALLSLYNISHASLYGIALTIPIAVLWQKGIDHIVKKVREK